MYTERIAKFNTSKNCYHNVHRNKIFYTFSKKRLVQKHGAIGKKAATGNRSGVKSTTKGDFLLFSK